LLLNSRGELAGLVSRRDSAQYGSAAAVGAKPFWSVLKRLINEHRVVSSFFGISVDDLTPDLYGLYGTDRGALVTGVDANMSGDTAGLKKGDLIVSLNERFFKNKREFSELMYTFKPDQNLSIGFVRNRVHKSTRMRLSAIDQSLLNPNAFSHKGMVVESLTDAQRQAYGLPEYLKGVFVLLVEPGSPAEENGLRSKDVIIQVNTKTIDDMNTFKASVEKEKKERFFIYRDGWNFIKLL
jgi:S1-C subfamily serine protease